MTDNIQCPNCGHHFALDEAFVEHFEEEKREAVQRAVDYAKEQAQLDIERLQEEFNQKTVSIEQVVRDSIETEYESRLREKDTELERIGKQLRELQRRTLQGSMELQGESLEIYVKNLIENTCPLDSISDVRKGHSGADFVHEIINPMGQKCGVIAWEIKNTKNWNDEWLVKLKDDASRTNADIKVIVTMTLPGHIQTFDLMNGVWVTCIDSAPALARVLREQLLQVASFRRAMDGREGKMEQVYFYLTSTTFRDRIQRIVETWQALKSQIDAEERAFQKQWKERRKQLDVMIDVTTEMYTDFSSIIGREMPQVEGLELDLLPDGGSN